MSRMSRMTRVECHDGLGDGNIYDSSLWVRQRATLIFEQHAFLKGTN